MMSFDQSAACVLITRLTVLFPFRRASGARGAASGLILFLFLLPGGRPRPRFGTDGPAPRSPSKVEGPASLSGLGEGAGDHSRHRMPQSHSPSPFPTRTTRPRTNLCSGSQLRTPTRGVRTHARNPLSRDVQNAPARSLRRPRCLFPHPHLCRCHSKRSHHQNRARGSRQRSRSRRLFAWQSVRVSEREGREGRQVSAGHAVWRLKNARRLGRDRGSIRTRRAAAAALNISSCAGIATGSTGWRERAV